jgi:hypothetical protein
VHDQGVEQFRNVHADGMVSSLHVLEHSLTDDRPSQEPRNPDHRTSYGNLDQRAPAELGGGCIQVHAEDRLEEVFLVSYSEKTATRTSWKRLKLLP